MAIRIEQPGLARLYGAAAVMSKAEKEAQKRQEQQARKEEIQMQQQYQQNMKLLDVQLDLEMYERSKRWEIDKLELRSRVDFEREEQSRQRKLDSADSAIQQIDKEVLAGRMTEQEAYPIKLKYEMSKMGADVPTSLLPREQRVDPMKQLIQRFLAGDPAPTPVPTVGGRVRVISPTGQRGTIKASEVESFRAKGFTITGEAPPTKKPTTKKVSHKLKPYGTVYREWL